LLETFSSLRQHLKSPRQHLKLSIALVAAIVVGHSLILASPGFFNHEEWDAFDHVTQKGLHDYVHSRVLAIPPAENGFSDSLRPIGYLHLGIAAQWMSSAPILSHGMSLIVHALVCLLLVRLLSIVGASLGTAYLSGALFAFSPLTTIAVGWIGANMDAWYSLFSILTCMVTVKIAKGGLSYGRAIQVLSLSALAVLSKETALILPFAMLLTALVWQRTAADHCTHWKALWAGGMLATVPVAAFFVVRLPALLVSFGTSGHPAYSPSLSNVPRNIVYYFAYPFIADLTELINIVFTTPAGLVIAAVLHAGLLVMLWVAFDKRWAIWYVVGYFFFLVPILALPKISSHYLYASGISMSVVLAALFVKAWTGGRYVMFASLFGLTAVLLGHSFKIQSVLYQNGVCEAAFLHSLDTRVATEIVRGTKELIVVPESGARVYVGKRAIAFRNRYDGSRGLLVGWVQHDQLVEPGSGRPGEVTVAMTRECLIR
jgi:hypothetical protein